MKWFPGSINDAVTAAKQREAIFVVFVEGKDEASLDAIQALNDEGISSRLDSENFVAIRVESNTESYTFFKQIYKTVPVPSIFFIGVNGVPLEIVAGNLSIAELSTKLDFVLTKAGKNVFVSSTSFAQERDVASSSSSSSSSMIPPQKTDDEAAASVACTNEEKVERARLLVEQQRRLKFEKEREDERRREIERRQLGKDLQTLKKKRHEAEIKTAYEERMREKAEEAEARERVLRQIAQDKLERKERELALRHATQLQENQEEKPVRSSVSSADTAAITRIQFRLPTGNSHMGKFDSTSNLGSLRAYVVANIDLPFRDFAMSTTFPRRDLNPEDDNKTLLELELVPTAVILILPIKNAKVTRAVTSSNEGGFVSRLLWSFLTPLFDFYNYVTNYFTGGDPANNSSSSADNRRSDGNVAGTSNSGMGRITITRDYPGGPPVRIRSRLNIHRLHSGNDDNDENNTWNGNSTQQM